MINMLEMVLRRPRTVLTLMLVLLVAGVFSYINVPKEAAPDIDIPVFYVSVSQQGVSPADAERLLARPMETGLSGLDGLKQLTTISSEGHVGVVLEYNIDFDKDAALADARAKVAEARSALPAEADEPSINEINFALQPTMFVTLSGDVPARALYRHARQLQDEIESIDTVLSADMSGQREEVLEIVINQDLLQSYGLTHGEMIAALGPNNQLIPAGFLDTGDGRFNIKVPGLIETRDDVLSLPLRQNEEGVVTLADIADVRRTFKDASQFTRVNGRPAIALEVVKRKGTNIIENNRAVRDVAAAASRDWPDAVHVDFLLDESMMIGEILGSLQGSIMTAIFLVMVLVVASLGLKSALLVGLAIPTSFMTGFLILSGLGMTVNTMVMFGLVLTVGMLVDGAIVMVEYADRKIAEGMVPREAYIRAARLMFWPIVTSTATTLVAFLPMLLWPGVAGEFMSYLPIMVIIVLSASLLTALVFLPVAGAAFSRALHRLGSDAVFIALFGILCGLLATFVLMMASVKALHAAPGGLLVAIGAIYTGRDLMRRFVARQRARLAERAAQDKARADQLSSADRLDPAQLGGFVGLYTRLIARIISTPLGNVLALGAAVLIIAGSIGFFMQNTTGVEFFTDEEPDRAIVLVSARGNLSAREALALAREVEAIILATTGIENVVMSAGPGARGDGMSDAPPDVIAQLNLELSDYCCRARAREIFERITGQTSQLAGINVEVRQIEGGPPTGKDLNLQITSTRYDDMVAAVARVRGFVDTMDGLRNREDGRPLPGIEWQVNIDRERAGRYQASTAAVGAMVQLATNGIMIGKYRPDDSPDEIEIRVRFPESERTLHTIDSMRIATPLGNVPLSNFVTRTAQQKVSAITRVDGLYVMNVKADVTGPEILPDDKVAELDAWIKGGQWPANVFFEFRGADEDQRESSEFLGRAMVAALFLMFIILVTQFNSFYQSILTLCTVVASVVGVLLGMAITGQKFSVIMTGTGIVALAGIVVNNAIVLIDTYNRLRHEGNDPLQAVLKTSAQRLRPVLLTTCTTIAGLIPMATMVNFDFLTPAIRYGSLNAFWWVQLSTAIISGLAFSTLLTLVFVPLMLSLPHVWSDAFRRWIAALSRLWSRAARRIARPASAPAGEGHPAPGDLQPERAPARLRE